MRVSVILPIFNGESTLKATLESLAAQTFLDFELVACIDGSTDNSEEILKRYQNSFLKMRILRNENNLGLGPTMNRLVANTQGEYIAVAEQDDFYYPQRLQRQVSLLDTQKEVGLVSGIAEFWNGEKVTGKFPGLLVHGKQYPKNKDMFLLNYREQIKVVNSCMMFRKSVHIENGLYFTQHYPSVSVDWTYVLRFSLVSKIHGLHRVLVRLDRRSERTSVTSNKEKQFAATRELLRSFAYEYPKLIKSEDYKFAKNTQRLLELSQMYGMPFYKKGLLYTFSQFQDNRFLKLIVKRLKFKIFSSR
jgi:glycosyltransferase involved in cell wall biosynthesis